MTNLISAYRRIALFKKIISFTVIYIFIASCSMADSLGVKIPDYDKERLLIKNLNLTFEDFLSAYLGDDLTQRHLAEMYLIGVLDANEGKKWCSYKEILPITLVEFLHGGLKDRNKEPFKNQRASEVILDFMLKFSPCKELN